MRPLLLLFAVGALGCSGGGDDGEVPTGGDLTCPDPTTGVVDLDADGAPADIDCDDEDPLRSPMFPEVCDDLIDNSCDGSTDDIGQGGTTRWYWDADQDGWGDSADVLTVCATYDPRTLWVEDGGDCAPDDPVIHPGVKVDAVCDLVDEDCDGSVDEDAPWAYYYPDGDGDGYGVWTDWPIYSCDDDAMRDMGLAPNPDDCDDTEPSIRPGVGDPPGPPDSDCDGYD